MNKKPTKRYVIEKVVEATSIKDAFKNEKNVEPNRIIEVNHPEVNTHAIGFNMDPVDNYED